MADAGGEFAAAAFMGLAHDDYQRKPGFMKGKGIDQVWVRCNSQGDMTEYLIVDAEGHGSSGEAKLQDTGKKGVQMSQRWVVQSLLGYSPALTPTPS